MSIEKTKANIKASKLGNKDRKELFDKFVKAGGEVVTEGGKRKVLSIDRERQKALIDKEEEKRKKRTKKWQEIEESKKALHSPGKTVKRGIGKESKGSFIDRLRINVLCWVNGISPLTGHFVSSKFIEFIDRVVVLAISNFNVIFFELFKANPQNGEKIIEMLDERNPLSVELLEYVATIYNKHELVKFSELSRKHPDNNISIDLLEDEITKLFRRLWFLKNYSDSLKRTVDQAYKFQMDMEKKSASMYSRSRKKAIQDLGLIFDKFFPKLYLLFLKMKGYDIPIDGQMMIRELKITDDELIGKRKTKDPLAAMNQEKDTISKEGKAEEGEDENGKTGEVEIDGGTSTEDASMENQDTEQSPSDKEKESSEENKADEQTRVIMDSLPKAIRIGLKIMNKLDLDKLKKQIDSSNRYIYMENKDKAFVAYLLFREFDAEFSFILTTNKIQLNSSLSSKGRTDYKVILSDIFLITDEIYDKFEHYNKMTEELKRHKDVQPSPSAYIQHAKRLTELENRRLNASRDMRNLIKEMMKQTSESLEILIRDVMGEKKIVANSEDKLIFDRNIEGKKKLNNQSVFNALQYTYAYAMAFFYRLGDNRGDLYGMNIEMEKDIMLERVKKEEKPDENAELESVSIEEQAKEDAKKEPQSAYDKNELAFPEDQVLGDKDQDKKTINDELGNLGF